MAACNNRNIFTCPASLPYVIGVKRDTSGIRKEREYIYNSFSPDGIDITACAIHELKKYNGESKITSDCNSFATPAITSQVCDIIKNNPDICLHELKELLKKKSAKTNHKENCKQYIKNNQQHKEHSQQQIESSQSDNNRNNYNYKYKNIDVPIMVIYDHYGEKLNDFYKKLTDIFRTDGYNAISISKESEQDLCNGSVSIKSYINGGKRSFRESMEMVFNIYDPDIIIVPVDMMNDNQEVPIKDVESYLEVDIRIDIHKNLSIDVMSTDVMSTDVMSTDEDNGIKENMKNNQSKTFTSNRYQTDQLYSYILSLFDAKESKK